MKKIEEGSLPEELSVEQKIWKGTGTFLYAIRPLLLYTVLPALLMTFGKTLWGGRTTDEIVSGSGNFYYTAGIFLTLYILSKRSKKRGSSLLEDVAFEYRGLNRKKIIYLACIGFGFGFFFSALITVVPFPRTLIESYSGASNSLSHGNDQLLALLSTIILAPITEEIIFRGYMLDRLLAWFSPQNSVLMVSIVFAIFHVSPIWIAYAFIMGVLLAKISIDEDNIAYSMILHIGFNLNVLPIWIINQSQKLSGVFFANDFLIAGYGIAACVMAVYFFNKYRKETKKW